MSFRYSGVHCGIRPDPEGREAGRLDLALIVSDRSARAAGVFTQNRVCAAPVQLCRERLPSEQARAIVICSGNANACTGERGLADARRMADVAGHAIDCDARQVLVCSTGVIGRPLPMERIEPGITTAARSLGGDAHHLDRASRAILTTDTRPKVSKRVLTVDGRDVAITGFAKGAAMIGPDMATMLAFVMTDAPVAREDLARLAPAAAARSFNAISVEGHTSTNDSLIFMANGDGPVLRGEGLVRFTDAALAVCTDLARAIAADAEGATHLITITVEGTRTEEEARRIAKTVANSALVKTAFFGADPNWGRIVSAAGYAGVDFEERQLSLWIGDFLLYERGAPVPFDAAAVSAFMRGQREFGVRLAFTLGEAGCTFMTSDLTADYVRLNADYTT